MKNPKKLLYLFCLLFCISVLLLWFYKAPSTPIEGKNLDTQLIARIDELIKTPTSKNQKEIQRYYTQALVDSNATILSKILYHKLELLKNQNNMDSTVYYGTKALFFVHQTDNRYLEARINYELGSFYSSNQQYAKSLIYLLKAKNTFEKSTSTNGVAHTYNMLGGVYLGLDNTKEALHYYEKAQKLFEEANDTIGKALVYGNISKLFTAEKQYKKAKEKLVYTFTFFESKKDTVNIINALLLLGDNLLYQDSIQKSLQYYQKAHNYATWTKDTMQQGHILLHFGNVYYKANEKDKALTNYLTGYRLSDYTVDTENLYNIAELYTQKKNHAKAYEYIQLYHTIFDSIKGASVQLKIANLQWENNLNEQKYKSNLLIKEKELEIQQYANQKRKYFNLSIASVLLIISISLLYINRNKSLKISRLENTKLEEKIRLEKEYQQLLTKQHQLELKTKNKLQLIEQKQHTLEVEAKNRELVTVNLQLLSKNKVLRELQLILQNKKENAKHILENLETILNGNLDSEKDWEYFQEIFHNIHPTFFTQLQQNCPELTKTELRVCAYIKINMTNSEMASLLNISVNSVLTTRYRIRKKLNLERADNLDEWIQNI